MIMTSESRSIFVPGNQFFTIDASAPPYWYQSSKTGERVLERKVLTVFQPGSSHGDRKSPNAHGFILQKTMFGGKIRRETNYFGNGRGSWADTDLVSYGQYPIEAAFGSTPMHPEGWNAAPWDGMIDSCMEKIYDQIRGNNNLIVDFAEGGQTLKMLKSALNLKKAIVKFCTFMAKDPLFKKIKRTRSKKRAHEYLSGKWLEYRYGWTPFIHSLYDAADNLKRDSAAKLITCKGRSSYAFAGSVKQGLGSYSNPIGNVQYSSRYRMEIAARFSLPGGFQASDWTSMNPAVIGWELLTLSFVADWFVNIGQQLKLWENYGLFSRQFVGGYKTASVRETRLAHYVGVSSYLPVGYWDSGIPFDGPASGSIYGSCRVDLSLKDRTPLPALPLPTGFAPKVNLNANRIVDAAAIVSGLVQKLLK